MYITLVASARSVKQDFFYHPEIFHFLQVMFAILGFSVIFLDIKLASHGKERMDISPKPFLIILVL